jgi:hypothetical protein
MGNGKLSIRHGMKNPGIKAPKENFSEMRMKLVL